MAQRKPFNPYTLLSRPKRDKFRRVEAGIVSGQHTAARSKESVVLLILLVVVLLMGYACGTLWGAMHWKLS